MGPETNFKVTAAVRVDLAKRGLNIAIGTDADSNILKIYRMLDRNNGFDKHYYQVILETAYSPTSQLIHRARHWHLCQHKVPLT